MFSAHHILTHGSRYRRQGHRGPCRCRGHVGTLVLGLAVAMGVGSIALSPALHASKYPHLEPNTLIMVRTTAYNHREADHKKYGDKNALGGKLRYSDGVKEHVNYTGTIRTLEPSVGSAAADWSRYPVGTRFEIVRTKQVFEVEDYGIALAGTQTIDLYKPSMEAMKKWGVRYESIRITKLGSFQRSMAHLQKAHPYPFILAMRKDVEERLKDDRTRPQMVASNGSGASTPARTSSDYAVVDPAINRSGPRPARMPAPPSQSAFTRNKPQPVDPSAWKRNMPK